jgi:hypothetical protein
VLAVNRPAGFFAATATTKVVGPSPLPLVGVAVKKINKYYMIDFFMKGGRIFAKDEAAKGGRTEPHPLPE